MIDARMALEKLTGEAARTEADLQAEIDDVKESLEAENAGSESFKRILATEDQKKNVYKLSAARRVRPQVACWWKMKTLF